MVPMERWTLWLSLLSLSTLLAIATGYMMNEGGGSEVMQCQVGRVPDYSVVPRGGLKVRKLKVLLMITNREAIDSCITKCCELGPTHCQYIWVIAGICSAVSCNDGSLDCDPINLPPTASVNSIYVRMMHGANNWSLRKHGKLPINPYETTTKHSSREGVGYSPDRVGGISTRPPYSVDNLGVRLVANAGPDVIIRYPESSVVLFGNASTNDVEVIRYFWELTSEDHLKKPTLLNRTSPVLKVLNLTPGTYVFTLTVTDSSLKISRDTVHVRVLDDPSTTGLLPEVTTTTSRSTTSDAIQVSRESSPLSNLTGILPALQTNSSASVRAESRTEETVFEEYSKKRNLLRIVVPVLLCVAAILFISGIIVTAAACFFQKNKKHMKRVYQYRRLPETIEKT